MGLTFRKRDDFDKLLDTLGVSNVDLVDLDNDKVKKGDKKEDPFAKFLEPAADKAETTTKADPAKDLQKD